MHVPTVCAADSATRRRGSLIVLHKQELEQEATEGTNMCECVQSTADTMQLLQKRAALCVPSRTSLWATLYRDNLSYEQQISIHKPMPVHANKLSCTS